MLFDNVTCRATSVSDFPNWERSAPLGSAETAAWTPRAIFIRCPLVCPSYRVRRVGISRVVLWPLFESMACLFGTSLFCSRGKMPRRSRNRLLRSKASCGSSRTKRCRNGLSLQLTLSLFDSRWIHFGVVPKTFSRQRSPHSHVDAERSSSVLVQQEEVMRRCDKRVPLNSR